MHILLERQRATGSLSSEVINPVQIIAYNSIPSTSEQPASCDGCDEVGYEVIDCEMTTMSRF